MGTQIVKERELRRLRSAKNVRHTEPQGHVQVSEPGKLEVLLFSGGFLSHTANTTCLLVHADSKLPPSESKHTIPNCDAALLEIYAAHI